MIPVNFPESNSRFGPPEDLDNSQCMTVQAYQGNIDRGSVEGAKVIVVAWKPSVDELKDLNNGEPVFLSCLGGLPPHFLTTKFKEAITPA